MRDNKLILEECLICKAKKYIILSGVNYADGSTCTFMGVCSDCCGSGFRWVRNNTKVVYPFRPSDLT